MSRPFKFCITSVTLTLLLLSTVQAPRAEMAFLTACWAVASTLSIGVVAFLDRFRLPSLLCFFLPFLGLLIGLLILGCL